VHFLKLIINFITFSVRVTKIQMKQGVDFGYGIKSTLVQVKSSLLIIIHDIYFLNYYLKKITIKN